jgi:hypothetical protein
MPVTPLTTEGRAIVARMRAFPSTEGVIHCLDQLGGPDHATVVELKSEVEASSASQEIKDGIEAARECLSHVIGASGNVGMWPLMEKGADGLDAALDFLEADEPPAEEEKPGEEQQPDEGRARAGA